MPKPRAKKGPEDYDDLRLLREAKMAEKDLLTVGLDEIKDEIEQKAVPRRRDSKSCK